MVMRVKLIPMIERKRRQGREDTIMTYTMTIAMEEGGEGGVTTGEVIEGPTEEITEEETVMGTEIIPPTMIMEEVVAIVVKDAVIIGRTTQATMIERFDNHRDEARR
jgi:hypothetical protein